MHCQRLIFLILDAFRGDYINPIDTPFLYEKAKEGTFSEKLKSSAGFAQRSVILTGTQGISNEMFTMYTFDEKTSPFRSIRPQCERYARKLKRRLDWIKKIPKFRHSTKLTKILYSDFVEKPRKAFASFVQAEGQQMVSYVSPAHIPFDLLPEIGISEDIKPIHLPGAFNVESIFDVLVKNNVQYDYLMYPVTRLEDDSVLDALIENKHSQASLVLGQFSDSDFYVHECGPKSNERRKIIGEIDRKLRHLFEIYKNDTTWLIIGDHGMTDVVDEIDITSVVSEVAAECGAEQGSDFVVFLDSTMARFKWKSTKGVLFGEMILKHPQLQKLGRFVSENIAKEYSIPYPNPRYGDLIWWADPGVLIFPDFFHDMETKNRGMHGYDSNHPDMHGFFLAFGPEIPTRLLDNCDLTDVCPSICHILGVRVPRQCVGNSLFAKV